MKPFACKACLAAILTATCVSSAYAHTTSIGYETVATNALNFWYGTYHAGVTFNEGSFRLVKSDGSFVAEIPYNLLVSTKPGGLIDGDTNFYSGGTSTVLSPTNTYPQLPQYWQGVSFTNLSPGTYTFTYVPIAVPTQEWAPINDAILSNTVTLIYADLADPATPRINVGDVVDETHPAANSDPVIFNGGTLKPTTDTTISNIVSVTSPGGTVDTSDGDLTLTGEVDGRGALTKIGEGTLYLRGNNTTKGGFNLNGGVVNVVSDANLGDPSAPVTFDGGTLQFGSSFDPAASRPITLNAGGGTIDTQSYATTIAQGIGGAGGLTKTGSGTLTLLGNNTYSGGTTISQGTLVGNTTSLHGNIVDNGALVFDQAVDGTFSGNISGSGSLAKDGAGILTLTGTNTYSGGTAVNGGTLVIGTKESLGTGPVSFGGGVLRFAYTGSLDKPITIESTGFTVDTNGNDQTMSAPLTGSGTFKKAGAGELVLTARNTLSGPTLVEAGRLAVNGSLAGSVATVQSGASLGGAGTVGGLIVKAGGVATPGNGIGTLSVARNLRLERNSTYEVEVNAAGQADRIAAGGTVQIEGSRLSVLAAQGEYRPSTSYTILTAAGGASGTFGPVFTNLAFLMPKVTYGATDVVLTLSRNDVAFPDVADTHNQAGVAAMAGRMLTYGDPVYDAIMGTTAAEARAGFDLLSGEIHASAATTALEDSRWVREAVLARLRAGVGPASVLPPSTTAAIPGRTLDPRVVGFWGQGFGSWGRNDGNGNAATLDRSTGGFVLGADALFLDRWRAGFAGGYTSTSVDIDGRSSSGEVQSVFGSLYGGTRFGALNLRIGTALAHNSIDTNRGVAIRSFGDNPASNYDGYTAQVFGEFGYGIQVGAALIEPFANVAAIRFHSDAFTEDGGAAALAGLGRNDDLGVSTLGVRAEASFGTLLPLTIHGTLGWRHAFGDTSPDAVLAFRSAPSGLFTVSGAPIAKDALVAETGLDWQVGQSVKLGLSYSGQIAEKAYDHAVKGQLEVRF